uniref:histidine phosphatase family protein n=1 Tax=Pseudomonas sp. SID14000 TaxID=1986221 RepID=UPI001C4879E9
MADAPYKLILLRHGESEWNAKNLFTGWVDVNLTDKGEKEAVRGGELLKGAGSVVASTGYELLAYSGGGGGEVGWERRYLSRLSGTLIDGAVIVTPTVLDTYPGVPVIAIDPHAGPSGLPTVDSDNLAGGVMATEHLISLGHRRIAHLGGRTDLDSARLREQGFRQ